jgi:hypothetical protein
MKPMSEKEIERWGRIRARGLRRFVSCETITFGLSSVFARITLYSLEFIQTGKLEISSKDYLGDLFFVPFFVALFGFIRGHLHWIKQEDRYTASRESPELKKADV